MNNIKIVSFTNRPYKYTDLYTKETEMMAKFDYQIQLAGKIAYFIRRNTNVADEYMFPPWQVHNNEYFCHLQDDLFFCK